MGYSADTPMEAAYRDARIARIAAKKALEKVPIATFDLDKNKVQLIKGDITKTAPNYVKKNKGFRISLLHLDLDTYHGTKSALQNFYPLVSKGGLIILDEYSSRGWGESDAVDEYFDLKKVKIKSIAFSAKPTAFIIKP